MNKFDLTKVYSVLLSVAGGPSDCTTAEVNELYQLCPDLIKEYKKREDFISRSAYCGDNQFHAEESAQLRQEYAAKIMAELTTEKEKEEPLPNNTDYNKILREAEGFFLATIDRQKDGTIVYGNTWEDSPLIDKGENTYKHFIRAVGFLISAYAETNAIDPANIICDLTNEAIENALEFTTGGNVTLFQTVGERECVPCEVDYDAAVGYMDDELREEIAAELAPCSKQMFLEEYLLRHYKKFGVPFRVD